MSQPSPLVDRRLAQQLSVAQLLVIPMVAALAAVFFDLTVAKNAASGALIGWLGSVYFAWQALHLQMAFAVHPVLFTRGPGSRDQRSWLVARTGRW